jgi:murein DD-endopeptidase MepM/ murein hydrolase activator NlpD
LAEPEEINKTHKSMNSGSSFYIIISLLIYCTSCKESIVSAYHERAIVELNVGETQEIRLNNGEFVKIKLLSIEPVRDNVRRAIRSADIRLLIDQKEIVLHTGNYNLPVVAGEIQIDCPVIKEYYLNASIDDWNLQKDARFRLWPKGTSWIEPGTFVFPIKQSWQASMTQAGNEPTYVDWGESPLREKIYYHAGVDFGGSEGLDEIVSATDGIVISARNKILEGYEHLPSFVMNDAVNVLDQRGWLIIYSHLDSTDDAIELGSKVQKGQRLGYIGKQGTSGGWVHLHFLIKSYNPNTVEWMVEDAYPFLWEAYVNEYQPDVIAVARPHHLAWVGEEVTLNGSKSKSFKGDIIAYEWQLSDGKNYRGAVQRITYDKPGEYSEILKVTDNNGNIGYDFTVVQVYDRNHPERTIPTIHASYFPTLGIKPGDTVSFFARTFNSNTGHEAWDFGDGSPHLFAKSDYVELRNSTQGKYSEVRHAFEKPGHYVVKVERENEAGYSATVHLYVTVNGLEIYP